MWLQAAHCKLAGTPPQTRPRTPPPALPPHYRQTTYQFAHVWGVNERCWALQHLPTRPRLACRVNNITASDMNVDNADFEEDPSISLSVRPILLLAGDIIK